MSSVIKKYKFLKIIKKREHPGINNDITKPLYNGLGAAIPEKLECLQQRKIACGLGLSNLISQEQLAKPAEK